MGEKELLRRDKTTMGRKSCYGKIKRMESAATWSIILSAHGGRRQPLIFVSQNLPSFAAPRVRECSPLNIVRDGIFWPRGEHLIMKNDDDFRPKLGKSRGKKSTRGARGLTPLERQVMRAVGKAGGNPSRLGSRRG